MSLRLTDPDAQGGMRFRPWAIPMIIFVIAASVAAAMALSGSAGAGVGLAVGALAATALLVYAARAKPMHAMEVAKGDVGRRVLVLATVETTPRAAERIAQIAGDADDVRLVVPVPSRPLDRWLSAEDPARAEAETRLAHSAGALTAAGLPMSGSVGDSNMLQAAEDELRSFAADEVVVVSDNAEQVEELRGSLALPLTRVRA
jgi:hypothetical protein